MKRLLRIVLACAIVGALAGGARAERSFWNASRTRIYTERDGAIVPGGKVGHIRMIQWALLVGDGPVVEFVQARTDGNGGLHWASSCVFITPDSDGTSDVAGDEETAALARVLDHWVQSTRSCGYLTLELEAPAPNEVGFDGLNVVKYREETWCRPPTDPKDPPDCYNPQAAALTTIFFLDKPGEPDDGEILDSDIEMNAVHFAIAVNCATGCESQGSGSFSDLENTLTHEIGHLVGLDHTCYDGSTPAPLPDDEGNPQPSCNPVSSLPPELRDATMFNFQDAGETKKISLEQDDIDGLCGIYPLANDPDRCQPVDIDGEAGCCTVAARPPTRSRSRSDGATSLLIVIVAGLTAAVRAVHGSRQRRGR